MELPYAKFNRSAKRIGQNCSYVGNSFTCLYNDAKIRYHDYRAKSPL